MKRILLAAAFAAAAGANARAEVVRFPETGYPAFVVTTPDGWTHQPDGDGNMLLVAGDRSASYALTISHYVGTLDALAVEAMKVAKANPPQQMGPTSISGWYGYMYDSDMTNPSGIHVYVHMVALKIGGDSIGSITRLTIDGIAPGDYAAAQSVLANTRIETGEK
ncbi:MAG TPA: hypothetical protein VMU08_10240 [Rhizomicrobium sp.]|nr:hypothetical protein [Rhizomicrobium sp.]